MLETSGRSLQGFWRSPCSYWALLGFVREVDGEVALPALSVTRKGSGRREGSFSRRSGAGGVMNHGPDHPFHCSLRSLSEAALGFLPWRQRAAEEGSGSPPCDFLD